MEIHPHVIGTDSLDPTAGPPQERRWLKPMSKTKLEDQPVHANLGDGTPWDGITYRQWAAAQIAAAMIVGQGDWKDECIAVNAVKLADTLIVELEQ